MAADPPRIDPTWLRIMQLFQVMFMAEFVFDDSLLNSLRPVYIFKTSLEIVK